MVDEQASVRGAALLGALATGHSLEPWLAGEACREFVPRSPSAYERTYARWLADSGLLTRGKPAR